MRIVNLVLALTVLTPIAAADSVLRWKLDVQPDKAKVNNAGRFEVSTNKGRQVYWYVVYTVTSSHDEDIPLHLHARAKTDSAETEFHEGYYPHALKKIRAKYGDDVLDNTQLATTELGAGDTIRAVAVFQFTDDGGGFDEAADRISVRFEGVADPVKKTGQTFTTEKIEIWQDYEKKGDAFDAYKESVRYVGQQEKVGA